MSKITVDPDLKKKLNDLTDQVELCDANGSTLGHFLPTDIYQRLVYSWAKAEFVDEKERAQARLEMQTEKGMTTGEAIAHLESIAKKGTRP
jgi:hypothetical protein